MGSKYARWLKLEELAAEQAIELMPEQAAMIEKPPCLRERPAQSIPCSSESRCVAAPLLPSDSSKGAHYVSPILE